MSQKDIATRHKLLQKFHKYWYLYKLLFAPKYSFNCKTDSQPHSLVWWKYAVDCDDCQFYNSQHKYIKNSFISFINTIWPQLEKAAYFSLTNEPPDFMHVSKEFN